MSSETSLDDWATLIKERRLTDDEFTRLRNTKVEQQNSHEFSDQYDGSCDHCIKNKLLVSQMSFGITTFEFTQEGK